jgi:hypothetical protein
VTALNDGKASRDRKEKKEQCFEEQKVVVPTRLLVLVYQHI